VQIDDIENSKIVEDVYIPSEITSDVDLIKSNTLALDETPIHEESISDVQDALVKPSTPISDDINISEDDTRDLEHVVMKSSY